MSEELKQYGIVLGASVSYFFATTNTPSKDTTITRTCQLDTQEKMVKLLSEASN